MSESYQPVEPKISSGPRSLRPARSTVLFVLVVLLMVVVVAAVQTSRAPQSPVLTAGATASPAASDKAASSARPDGSGKPDKARLRGLGQGGFGHMGRDIRITAISGDRVSLATDDGWQRTVTVAATTELTKGGQAIKAGDLAVGDEVRIAQERNDDGTYTVTAIHVVLPVTGGKVTAVDSDSITLERRGGATQVVTIDGGTAYKVGKTAGSRSDVVVGSIVIIEGTESGTTFTATTVHVQPVKAGGTVTKVSGSTITVERRDGSSQVIHVDADTTYRVKGKDDAALSDIKVGDRVEARGTVRADGSIDADRVSGRTPKAKPKPTATPGA